MKWIGVLLYLVSFISFCIIYRKIPTKSIFQWIGVFLFTWLVVSPVLFYYIYVDKMRPIVKIVEEVRYIDKPIYTCEECEQKIAAFLKEHKRAEKYFKD